jgi:hypothetical protein
MDRRAPAGSSVGGSQEETRSTAVDEAFSVTPSCPLLIRAP